MDGRDSVFQLALIGFTPTDLLLMSLFISIRKLLSPLDSLVS